MLTDWRGTFHSTAGCAGNDGWMDGREHRHVRRARSEGGARFVALDLDSAHFEVASGKRRRTCRRVPTANASVRPGMVAVVLHAAPLPTMQGINFLSEATG